MIKQKANLFSGNFKFPTLSAKQRYQTEADKTEHEIKDALKSMKNGSAPGPDGLPAELYKLFWHDIKDFFMHSLDYSQQEGKLCPSQRQGTIGLIHKGKELPKENLTNWRPISLTNADYKIISKALALRIKKILPHIMHDNQTGFVKGRNISTTIRQIDDEIIHESNKESVFLSLDYSKAFDTLSTSLIPEALEKLWVW